MTQTQGCFFLWLQREFLIYSRRPSEFLNPVLFYMMIIAFFPMGISLEMSTLQKIAPGLVWIAVLLSNLMSMDRVFYEDYQSGILEQILLKNYVAQVIYAKLMVVWLLTALPMIIFTPIVALMYNLNFEATVSLILALLVGTPIISVLVITLSAIVILAGNRNALISLIFLPLVIPVLIFGAGSTWMTMQGGDGTASILLLLSATLIFGVIGPIIAKRALYLSLG